MVEVLRESVRGRPKSQQADKRLCCIEALTAACDVWHHSQRGGNNQSESNCTPTTALRQMGGWKQLCTEINIAGCVMLTGRLSGRGVAYCNRITDTLGKGEALSFWISPTFRSAPCTAATAGLMYSGVKKTTKKNACRTKCTHLQGDAHLQGTPTSHLRIRKTSDHLPLDKIQKSRRQEVTSPGCYQQPSRLNSGFCLSSSRCAVSSTDWTASSRNSH